MYRNIQDFIEEWDRSSDGTLQVFKALTNDKLNQSIADDHNTLGWLAWHLVGATGFFGSFIGLSIPAPGNDEPIPSDAAEIVSRYELVAKAIKDEASKLTDAQLVEEIQGFAGPTTRGRLLRGLIDHQTHHRGQMTVLLRQANLNVPPIMGPTKEMANI